MSWPRYFSTPTLEHEQAMDKRHFLMSSGSKNRRNKVQHSASEKHVTNILIVKYIHEENSNVKEPAKIGKSKFS